MISKKNYNQTGAKKQMPNFLIDKADSGKERPWKDKKVRGTVMSELHDLAGISKKAERMASCGDFLFFKKMSDGSMKLERAYFCKARLCPMCTWRRSLKLATQNHAIIKKANEEQKLNWLLVTLTSKNPLPHELKKEIDNLMAAWNRMVGYKKFNDLSVGWFRALEVTKNRDESSKDFGTYNPHFHVLIAVRPGYFSGKAYVKQKEWVAMWKKALKVDYEPIVDVRRVKAKKPEENSKSIYEIANDVKGSIEEFGAILEVSKYPVKDSDIVDLSEGITDESIETVQVLDEALAKRRLVSHGGLLKEIHQKLKMDDAEDGDLVHVEEKKDEIADEIGKVMARWSAGFQNYIVRDL